MNEIEKKVLKKITPSKEYREKLQKILTELELKLINEIKQKKLAVEIKLVGSIAKDTYLQNNMDIDFFICFPTKYSKDKIAENSLSIGKKLLKKTEESYAEHPYIRGYYKKYYVEIVPCYKIENAKQKLSAVDRTPLHTQFVIENIKEEQKSEIRLIKQFLRGINCYGAEAQIQGFSGYLCEILILKYKTFENLIKNAQKWKPGSKLALSKSDYPDFDTPLIFIDPVDSNRNVASAISKEKFSLFIKACIEYLKKPSETFFFPNEIKPWSNKKIKEEILKQNKIYISIKFDKPEIIDENLYPQIRKAIKSITESCKRADFSIYDSTYFIDNKKANIIIILKLKDEKLSETFIHTGPPTKDKENSEDFLNKWKNNTKVVEGPYDKNGRFYVEIKREYTDIRTYLKKNIKSLSLGKHLDKKIKKKYELLELNDLIHEDYRSFWTEFLDNKMPWER